jgi:hypothetical protein
MAYIVSHQHRDGRVERTVETIDGSSPSKREVAMKEGLAETRKSLRDKKGWAKGKKMRLVARIPAEVVSHALLNHGREAANDIRFLIRHADHLGIDCRVSKGRF